MTLFTITIYDLIIVILKTFYDRLMNDFII